LAGRWEGGKTTPKKRDNLKKKPGQESKKRVEKRAKGRHN